MKVQWITHNGKQILFTDYNGVKSQDEMIEILYESNEAIKNAPGKVLSLIDSTNATVGPDFLQAAKEQGKELMYKIDKTAMVGVTGLKAMLLKGYNMFTGMDMIPFATKEDALEYLVS